MGHSVHDSRTNLSLFQVIRSNSQLLMIFDIIERSMFQHIIQSAKELLDNTFISMHVARQTSEYIHIMLVIVYFSSGLSEDIDDVNVNSGTMSHELMMFTGSRTSFSEK